MVKVNFKGYKIKNCQLKHEEFVKERHDETTSSSLHSEEGHYKRRGFCPKSSRDENLACAHSMAWFKWMDELRKYPSWLGLEKVQALLNKMNQTRTEIFELDHKKGELEKEKLLDPSSNCQSATAEIMGNYDNLILQLQTDMGHLMQHFDKFHQE